MNIDAINRAYALLDEISGCLSDMSEEEVAALDRNVRILLDDFIDLTDYWDFLLECLNSDMVLQAPPLD